MLTPMINLRGRVVLVRFDEIDIKKALGWTILPAKFINEKGQPKQQYFPQYDMALVGKAIPITEEEEKRKEILTVEII